MPRYALLICFLLLTGTAAQGQPPGLLALAAFPIETVQEKPVATGAAPKDRSKAGAVGADKEAERAADAERWGQPSGPEESRPGNKTDSKSQGGKAWREQKPDDKKQLANQAKQDSAAAARERAKATLAQTRVPVSAETQVGLFAAAVLLGFGLFGGLVGAVLHAPAIIPFRGRVVRVALLLGGGLVLLTGYGYFLGPQNGQPLLWSGLAGVGALATGVGYHRLRQPPVLP